MILRPDGIGDAINSTPAISALRKSYPIAHISLVASPLNAEIFALNPNIDEIIVYNEKSLRGKLHFCENLRLGNYDLAVVLCNVPECNLMAYLSGSRYRFGWKYPRRKLGFVLTHRFNQRDPKGTKHEVDRNMDIVRLAGADGDNKELSLCLSEEERAFAQDFIYSHNLDKNPKSPIIGIHPGGSAHEKLWSAENFAIIADRLISEFNAQIIIFNGPGEEDLAKRIQNAMINKPIFAAGLKLRHFAALVERCSLFICNDSGPMHIAAALKVPITAIFGPTDHVRWRPYNEKAIVVRKDMDCWPCSINKCKKSFECIKSLPVDNVWNIVSKQFDAGL